MGRFPETVYPGNVKHCARRCPPTGSPHGTGCILYNRVVKSNGSRWAWTPRVASCKGGACFLMMLSVFMHLLRSWRHRDRDIFNDAGSLLYLPLACVVYVIRRKYNVLGRPWSPDDAHTGMPRWTHVQVRNVSVHMQRDSSQPEKSKLFSPLPMGFEPTAPGS